jgi:hypothetical protein
MLAVKAIPVKQALVKPLGSKRLLISGTKEGISVPFLTALTVSSVWGGSAVGSIVGTIMVGCSMMIAVAVASS